MSAPPLAPAIRALIAQAEKKIELEQQSIRAAKALETAARARIDGHNAEISRLRAQLGEK